MEESAQTVTASIVFGTGLEYVRQVVGNDILLVAAYAIGMLFPHFGQLLFPARQHELPVCQLDTP